MTSAYLFLLNLYPRDYKLRFAPEMAQAFETLKVDRQRKGQLQVVCFVIVELFTLLMSAAAEWKAKMTSSPSVRWRCLPDLMVMRPSGISTACWYQAGDCEGDRRKSWAAQPSLEIDGENS